MPDDTLIQEIRLGVDRTSPEARKIGGADEKAIQAVLERRLPIFAAKGGSVQFNGPDDIRLRVPSDLLNPAQLKEIGRMGKLEFRHLEDVQTGLSRKARYQVETITIQDETHLRFRDTERNRPVPAAEFLERSPLIMDNSDVEPDSARVPGGGVAAIHIQLKPRSAKRLAHFMKTPGRLLAITLDGEILSINVSPPGLKIRTKEDEKAFSQMDIAGTFHSALEAGYVAVVLNSGPLPCPLRVLSTRVVPPATSGI